ncbi:MAG: NifU family protein [Gemmataceae bacterium]|nr:NifU family protein [Gemmata sp.]MDW8196966.1 NifU family protein [Gemmataceae bacterium]
MTEISSTLATPAADDLDALAAKVDQAAAAVRGLPEEARRRAWALQAAVEEIHKLGFTKIVRALKADPRGKEILWELVDDPVVRMLFAMHGLIRADLRTRAERVIEMIRPHIQSHGGDVTLLDVQDGIAHVRLSGSCTGCSMAAVTLRTTVEEALKEQCPEITEVRQVPAEPAEAVTFVPLGLPVTAGKRDTHGWIAGPTLAALATDRGTAVDTPAGSVLVIQAAGGVRAYRNQCPHQGLPLEGGKIDPEANTLACPWHGFRFDCDTGECLTAPAVQLEQFPVRIDNGVVWVRPS